ncbi:MAG TPA: hypothetical protein VHP11_00965, partial [Tepidisphaeraceae bacterium]|nr:hypothetical protein [Tepidisphaeraceae bacterium]
MACPNISATDVASVIPLARDIEFIADGGQKRVFRAKLEDVAYAFKFLRPNIQQINANGETAADGSIVDDVTARAKREVETMGECRTPHLVKPGPIRL